MSSSSVKSLKKSFLQVIQAFYFRQNRYKELNFHEFPFLIHLILFHLTVVPQIFYHFGKGIISSSNITSPVVFFAWFAQVSMVTAAVLYCMKQQQKHIYHSIHIYVCAYIFVCTCTPPQIIFCYSRLNVEKQQQQQQHQHNKIQKRHTMREVYVHERRQEGMILLCYFLV